MKLADEAKVSKIILEGAAQNVVYAMRSHSYTEDWTGMAFIKEGRKEIH